MNRFDRLLQWSWLAVALTGGIATTAAQTAPKASRYGDAPEVYRSFIERAKQAEAITDPLKRCLAYPDYPEQNWPTGLVVAYCHYSYDPTITLDTVKELLGRNALAELDSRFKADLDRHFSKANFSEAIHHDLGAFDASVDAGQISMHWLDKSPRSPYALAARGEYFLSMALKARNTKWAADTPPENMQRMSEFIDQAIDKFQQALVLEPRLLEADVGIMSAASLDSRNKLGDAAFAHGMSVDPACMVLTGQRMENLEPRWGGSYSAMSALAVQLSASVPQRPLLALNTIWPQVDAADMASRSESYDAGLALMRSVLTDSAEARAFDDVGVWMDHATSSVDRWEQLVVLLEASRFAKGSHEGNRVRGRLLLLLAKEPAWAIASLKSAVAADLGDAYAHYLLGAAYWNSGSPAKAEPDYLAAMKDPDTRRDALHELTQAMLASHQVGKSRRYVDMLNKEYPKFAPGWMTRASVLLGQGINGDEVTQVLRKFVATADPNDLDQMMQLHHVQDMLRKMSRGPAAAAKQ